MKRNEIVYKQFKLNFFMILFLYPLFIKTLQDPLGIKDEFEGLKKRVKKLNQAGEADEEQKNAFDDTFIDEISANSDDVNSTNEEQKPYDLTRKKVEREVPKVTEEAENKKYIEDLTEKLNKSLGLNGEISSLTNEKSWEKLYKHFETNFGDYFVDGKFSIPLHIRYFMCCYIIIFIPGEFAFFYPAMWPELIPDAVLTNEIMKSVLSELRLFQKFVKKKSTKTLLVTFYFGRKNSMLEDLKFIINIPFLIFSDPLVIVRELLSFELKSEGYEDFKKDNNSSYFKW